MVRAILLLGALTALAACGGGDGGDSVHDVGACMGTFDPSYVNATVTQCERACASGPQCGVGDNNCYAALPACKVKDESTGFPNCSPFGVVTFEGERGCCAAEGTTMRFTPCEGQ